MMKLFLDDLRDPPDQIWYLARSYDAAVQVVYDHGYPIEVSFDHDLGTDQTGLDFAHYLIELDLDEHTMPDNFSYTVHSANPPGAENIEGLMNSYLRSKWPAREEL